MFALLALVLAPQEPVLTPDAEARWVPFELTAYNQIRFTMQAGGRDATAILDTGISHTVIARPFASVLGLKRQGSGRASAIGGTIAMRWAAAPQLVVGGLSRSGGRVAVAEMPARPGQSADIYVGADLLGCCALDIDYAARRFRILPSGRMPFTGDRAPLSRMRGSGVFVTELTIGGHRLRPVLVDTGDGSWLTLTREAWAAARPPAARVTTTLGYGAGGALISEAAILPSVMLGNSAGVEAEVRIEAANGFSAGTGTAGRIGSGLLMRYRVLLDPRAGRMMLRAGESADAPVLRSTSGLLLDYDQGALKVLHVMRGSPAEEAGWKADDRICSADGVSARDDVESDGKVDWAVGAPGRTVRLGACDGREMPITLRKFY
ncbi:retropepsin-like aspartic protease [Sphingomonas sp.]|jgi:hypothetical protein|uniref:retropepsin-like aspartic protease n=1 Tax=Sphingomonas sp. TaxID=28214 RepID=UPI002ED96D30